MLTWGPYRGSTEVFTKKRKDPNWSKTCKKNRKGKIITSIQKVYKLYEAFFIFRDD